MVLLPAARADLSSTTAVSSAATISTPLAVQVERVSSEFSRFAALQQATAQLDSTTVNSAQWLEAAEAALTAFDVSRSATPDSSASSKRRAGDAAIDDVYDAAEDPELLRSSPRNWKSLDLYAVLGLSKLRYKATSGQLKSAYHRKVLVHHPDRKLLDLGTGDADDDEEEEDAFFKIVQKAYETLSNPTKRREYDSVDPFYYESSIEAPPPASKPSSDADFFALYGPVFEREARFASKTPAPTLGDMTSSYDQIQGFYSYWGSFQSWRSFEFLDEEDKESAENRDHRRYLERKNKAERARRKTEDTRRVQKIVEQAQRLDPRIVAFKEKEKQAKQQKKLAKEAAAKEAELAAKAEAEAQQKREEEEAAAAKEQQAAEKRQRETAKKQVQKARKQLR
ncbi:DnaJ-domain-containing protein, partial [Ramicandelaber brevisporus]